MTADPIHRLTLDPLAASAWRLCDERIPRTDAANLVAYVEASDDGGFEVTWVYGGAGVAWFPTLDELFIGAARHVDACAPRRRKPKPIAHRPPLAAM